MRVGTLLVGEHWRGTLPRKLFLRKQLWPLGCKLVPTHDLTAIAGFATEDAGETAGCAEPALIVRFVVPNGVDQVFPLLVVRVGTLALPNSLIFKILPSKSRTPLSPWICSVIGDQTPLSVRDWLYILVPSA